MLINLRKMATAAEAQPLGIELTQRLPTRVLSPCPIEGQFKVEKLPDYYLMTLQIDSLISLVCQRCLSEFSYHYLNETQLAITYSEEIADKLMSQYDCIVSADDKVDLTEIVTDELYLYLPEAHPEINDCDSEIKQFIIN